VLGGELAGTCRLPRFARLFLSPSGQSNAPQGREQRSPGELLGGLAYGISWKDGPLGGGADEAAADEAGLAAAIGRTPLTRVAEPARAAVALAAAAVGILAIGCAGIFSHRASRRRATALPDALLARRALTGEIATLHARAGAAVQLGIDEPARVIDAALSTDAAAAELAGTALRISAAFVGTRRTLAAAPVPPLLADAGATVGGDGFAIAALAIRQAGLSCARLGHKVREAERRKQRQD
jgi:hypothetical protein